MAKASAAAPLQFRIHPAALRHPRARVCRPDLEDAGKMEKRKPWPHATGHRPVPARPRRVHDLGDHLILPKEALIASLINS